MGGGTARVMTGTVRGRSRAAQSPRSPARGRLGPLFGETPGQLLGQVFGVLLEFFAFGNVLFVGRPLVVLNGGNHIRGPEDDRDVAVDSGVLGDQLVIEERVVGEVVEATRGGGLRVLRSLPVAWGALIVARARGARAALLAGVALLTSGAALAAVRARAALAARSARSARRACTGAGRRGTGRVVVRLALFRGAGGGRGRSVRNVRGGRLLLVQLQRPVVVAH